MAKKTIDRTFTPNPRKKRPGIVAKSKASKNPNSKNYLKRYRGQGR
jgi:hypothetical protein